jgi:SEC-C motif
MRMRSEEYCDRDFRRGKRALANHRPDIALRSFRSAADSCPAARAGELSAYLYWLAIALLRLDRPELALKSLASAQKLRPKGYARSMYLRRSNEYGMCRRKRPELDDFYAFYSVQACAYLGRKPSGRFDSNAEKDMVTRFIGDAWKALSVSGALEGLSAARKLEAFKTRRISFPFFSPEASTRGAIIETDFRRGQRIKGDDRCSCGSGLSYARCCGRIDSNYIR